MRNRDIFPSIGKILTGENAQVFIYICLPKVLGNTVDFLILMQNFRMELYDMVEFDRARNLF